MDEKLLKLIQEIVDHVTGTSTVTYDTDFVKDLGLSSFDVMNMIFAFEEYFNTEIPTRDVWQMHRVQDVIDYIKKREMEKNNNMVSG